MVLDAHESMRAVMPGAELQAEPRPVLLLLAPRHPRRFESVAQLLTRRGIAFALRSAGELAGVASTAGQSVLLVDTVGELAELYAAADVAFVGGSFVPIGGHNLLEPAALGLPVLTGPHNFNAKDIAQLLMDQGAVVQVADAHELAQAVSRLLAEPSERARIGGIGRRLVEANRGSVARVLELIAPLLADPAAVVPPDPASPVPPHRAAVPARGR